MKYSQVKIMHGLLTMGDNPRIDSNLHLEPLMESIELEGLKEMITVWEKEKGIIEVIRGHRRTMAIGLLSKVNPARFEELFGKGVPCLKVSEVTSDEVVSLKLDHTEQRGLTDPHELQRSANMLFAIGKTEQEVANNLAGLIDRMSPMNQKARLELEALKQSVQAAKATGNEAAVTLAEQAVKKFIGDYRRGFIQNLHNTYRCPDKVMHSLFKAACGHAPEGVTEYLPKLTSATVTGLWNAHKKDLEIRENGVPKFNKALVGPHFTEKWNALVKKEQEAVANGEVKETRPKAMSAKEMQESIKNGEYKSQLACKLTFNHAGDAKSADLPALDEASYLLDLIAQNDKALYDSTMQAGKEILNKLIATATAEAAK